MSLKTYDRTDQVWSARTMITASGDKMKFIVSAPDGKVRLATIADNLKSRCRLTVV
jgi:hypothetical protein